MVLWRSCLIDETLRESELWPESYPPENGGWVLNLPKCCSIENHILHTFAFLLRVIEVFFFDTCELVLINVHVCAEKHWSVWNVGFFFFVFFFGLEACPAVQNQKCPWATWNWINRWWTAWQKHVEFGRR